MLQNEAVGIFNNKGNHPTPPIGGSTAAEVSEAILPSPAAVQVPAKFKHVAAHRPKYRFSFKFKAGVHAPTPVTQLHIN
jgi:hypothetical protein